MDYQEANIKFHHHSYWVVKNNLLSKSSKSEFMKKIARYAEYIKKISATAWCQKQCKNPTFNNSTDSYNCGVKFPQNHKFS